MNFSHYTFFFGGGGRWADRRLLRMEEKGNATLIEKTSLGWLTCSGMFLLLFSLLLLENVKLQLCDFYIV